MSFLIESNRIQSELSSRNVLRSMGWSKLGDETQYDDALLGDILQWDVSTWKKAVFFWDEILAARTGCGRGGRALDIGARDGGLSLWLALKGYEVICSDVGGPSPLAAPLHERHGVSSSVEYRAMDATDMDIPDESIDIVVFKSILGGIGTYHNVAAIDQALAEIRRVLKPGGLLFFAENLLGSAFHRFARTHFVEWGKRWHYPSLDELELLLAPFESFEMRSYGFFSCVKKDFAPFVFVDRLICRQTLSSAHYMGYGYAVKGE